MNKVSLVCALLLCCCTSAFAEGGPWQGVEKVFARQGIVQKDMFKLTFPRTDLSVKRGEVAVEPGLALTSWIAFRAMGTGAMMMGDLVLLEGEVEPVVAKLVAEGVQITAIHNHLIGTTPAIIYLHFAGEGDPARLAAAMRVALSATGTPLALPAPPAPPATLPDWSKVEIVLGKNGAKKGNLLQYGFPRPEKITEKGMEIPPFLGMATGINLQMVGDRAATTGDFVLVADEVNPVVAALTANGIEVTAIHSHMLSESPRLFFLHFWGYDAPEKLARGLKAALDRTGRGR